MTKFTLKDKNQILRVALISTLILNIAFIGAILNLTVMTNNYGKMPVYIGYYFNEPHHFGFIYPNEVKLWYLSDIINLSNRFYEHYLSVGDVLCYLAFFGSLTFCIIHIKTIYRIYKKSKSIERR